MSKNQRAEELMSVKDRSKIHLLYRTYHIAIPLIAERFGIDDNAVKDILARPHVPPDKRWRVKWDDEEGERRERTFETFRAAKMFHARLNAEWSKIEPTR